MKRIFFTLLILSAVSFVRAQNSENSFIKNDSQNTGSNLKFGLSINPGLNLGRFGSDLVLSGDLGLYKSLTNNLEATFSAGYIGYSNALIHVKPGFRYSLNDSFYTGVQAGIAISTTEGGAYFAYSPTIGYKLNTKFDVGLKYDHVGRWLSVLGLNLTYRIGL